MRRKIHKVHSKKSFLNKSHHHSDASIFSSINIDEQENWIGNECELKIRDCDRTVRISIEIYDEAAFQNSIFKINKLISHLQCFKEKLEEGRVVYKQADAAQKARRKQREKEEKRAAVRGRIEEN